MRYYAWGEFKRWMGFVGVSLVVLLSVARVSADPISDWNERALRAAANNARGLSFPELSEILAILNVAMFDAVNAVDQTYEPYVFRDTARVGASAAAAATTAAYTILVRLFPDQVTQLGIIRDAELAHVRNVARRDEGVWLGESAAREVLASREGRSVFLLNVWRPVAVPGVYVPTTFPAAPSLPKLKPWALASADQFRPKPPPSLLGDAFADDYNEVRTLGALVGSLRTEDQARAARFWVMSGVHAWNRALSQIVKNEPTVTLVEHARFSALLNMALVDSYISSWEAKYHYNFWRPVTAIRNGDRTGNSRTPVDPGWLPLVETPLHPEYPSGHSANLGAAIAVLEPLVSAIGTRSFSIANEEFPGVLRSFGSIHEMGTEISSARVWGGMHFRSACEAGTELGRSVGRQALETKLSPKQAKTLQ